MYTVKQLSTLAGVSVRTLHYYDEIALFKPAEIGENGYRYYTDGSLFTLQQILLYREIGLSLAQIKRVMNEQDFDLVSALQSHRETLMERIGRLQSLVSTVDTTIMHLVGEVNMSKNDIFTGFDEKQAQYEQQAIVRYGEEEVKATTKRWNRYSDEEKKRVKQEGSAIYEEIAAVIDLGVESDEVQALLVRWHNHLRYFYDPSLERLRGLGNSYNEHPDFQTTFAAIAPELPGFLQIAIQRYVDRLEGAKKI